MDAIEKMRQIVANCYHAGMGRLDQDVPYPHVSITLGDLREAVEICYALRGNGEPLFQTDRSITIGDSTK